MLTREEAEKILGINLDEVEAGTDWFIDTPTDDWWIEEQLRRAKENE